MTIADDDIFARPPRSARIRERATGRITCRVCDTAATVPLDHPAVLCPLCLENLDATRARVAEWLEKTLAQLDSTKATWDTTLARSAASERWEPVQAALIGVAEKRVDQAAFDAAWAKRKAEGGSLAELLIAYEHYCAETDRLGAELARLDRAQTEINQVWLGTPLDQTETHDIFGARKGEYEIYLRSNKESDQERARELCNTYNTNYTLALEEVKKTQ